MSASSAWYSERREPDVTLNGTLRRRVSGTGPGNRPGLAYELELADGKILPVYGPTVHENLRPLIGHSTELTGKLVDLTAEGFGVELWIGDPGAITAA
jgi:hypothetical protein